MHSRNNKQTNIARSLQTQSQGSSNTHELRIKAYKYYKFTINVYASSDWFLLKKTECNSMWIEEEHNDVNQSDFVW